MKIGGRKTDRKTGKLEDWESSRAQDSIDGDHTD